MATHWRRIEFGQAAQKLGLRDAAISVGIKVSDKGVDLRGARRVQEFEHGAELLQVDLAVAIAVDKVKVLRVTSTS
jgi:hypothetical protein